jgi:hypothetical protein
MAKKKSARSMAPLEQAAMKQRPKSSFDFPYLGISRTDYVCSPYSTAPVAIYVGPEREPYYVASGLLQNPEWINTVSWNGIQLPDVDKNTGHVLVHFLCTGTYQTLDNIEVSPEEEARVEFKRAFSAFVMANTYKLATLQQLAMNKIKLYGMRMTMFDIVDAIDEDFSTFSDSTTEFEDYLTTKAKDAFQKDYNVFYDNGIFDRITNVALSKALANCVMVLYKDKITHMLQAEQLMQGMLAKRSVMTDEEVGGEKEGSGYQDIGGVDSKKKSSDEEAQQDEKEAKCDNQSEEKLNGNEQDVVAVVSISANNCPGMDGPVIDASVGNSPGIMVMATKEMEKKCVQENVRNARRLIHVSIR